MRRRELLKYAGATALAGSLGGRFANAADPITIKVGAVAPIYAKYNYPLITQACVTDQIDPLTKRYPNLFIVQGSTTAYATSAINVLKKLKDAKQIGNKVAVVNVGDDFGIELANAGRP